MDNTNKKEEFTIPIYDETNKKVGTVVGIVGDEAYQQICEENGGTLPERYHIDTTVSFHSHTDLLLNDKPIRGVKGNQFQSVTQPTLPQYEFNHEINENTSVDIHKKDFNT